MMKKYIMSHQSAIFMSSIIKFGKRTHKGIGKINSNTTTTTIPRHKQQLSQKHEWLRALNRMCAHPFVVGKGNKYYYSQETTEKKRVLTIPKTQALEVKAAES